MLQTKTKKVLIGVFDWGLGHATRDTPLIEEILRRGYKLDILSTGRALVLLKKKFGNRCRYFDVPSIDAPYPKHKYFVFSFTVSIPEMLFSINQARRLSAKIISKEKYDIVISDCRYDVYDKPNNSYLINHQVRFDCPSFGEKAAEKWLASRYKKYKYVLVPDFQKNNLTGRLSHNLLYVKGKKLKYVGILSQVKQRKLDQDIDYFISISGPEPQRTALEKVMRAKLNKLKGKIVVALGKPEIEKTSSGKNIQIYGYLDSIKQEEMMNRSKFIICRSGYTTVMELTELGNKKVLFIPTPGQTEQVYLAKLYEKKKYFHFVEQQNLDILKDIAIARKFNGFIPEWKTKDSVDKILDIIGLN